ncbi:hypothetical protein BDR26DRAFT_871865 [Obelidium mucronatum]|nr:hypothetical protein BDR26DRAFT_871865 [Obelidium mucronatum]
MNILNNFLRGIGVGMALILLITTILLRRLFTVKTTIASAAISILFAIGRIFSFSYDFLALQDCTFRVRFIYTVLLLQQIAYWLFQADITFTVNASSPKAVPGFSTVLSVSVLFRLAVGIIVANSYTGEQAQNLTCESVLPEDMNLFDKISEVVYCLILSLLFIYPLFTNVKEIREASSSKQSSTVGPHQGGPKSRGDDGSHIPGVSWIKRIINDQGSILILTLVVQAIYLVCVYMSSNRHQVSMWNALFSSEYMFFMTVYMCSKILRASTSQRHFGMSRTRSNSSIQTHQISVMHSKSSLHMSKVT